MLNLYKYLILLCSPLLSLLLRRRIAKGKEDPARIGERKGVPGLTRPDGKLLWIHAASVGESQSALILINNILKNNNNLHILVTTGTVTSAQLMAKNLPKRALHQFYPIGHPAWVERFLEYWRPDAVFWMESELWPNMLRAVKARAIPAALVNARLSDKSFARWNLFKGTARTLLDTFDVILTQTPKDEGYFKVLGAKNVITTDNLKFSAAPLPADENALKALQNHLQNRPLWLYASTHKGEEEMACRIHKALKTDIPSLLTMIVPRHPNRRHDIEATCTAFSVQTQLRGEEKTLPDANTDIYIADTLGELGLFYRLAPVACIGRSFSDDGGGGHNPIEAAQLNCAVLHGPHIQYQQDIYDEMNESGAALCMKNETEMTATLKNMLSDETTLHTQQERGAAFAAAKNQVIERVMTALSPILNKAGIAS